MAKKLGKKGSTAKILIISQDVIGKNMAGPGIRCYEFAKVLSGYLDVTLAAPNKIDINIEGFKTIQYSTNSYKILRRYSENMDIILIQGHILYYLPFLKNFTGKIIVDLYNPFNLESLEMYKNDNMSDRIRIDKNNLHMLKLQFAIGDFFMCASEKQRDYWIGMLNAAGRINPYTYDRDSTIRKLIDVVPFGIPQDAPEHTKEVAKGVMPNIKGDDKIALWGGGIWNWLDPITAIKALWEITRSRKDVKMIFVGTRHPDPKLKKKKKCIEAIRLSKELDLFGEYAFFNEWTPYGARQNFLIEADVGLSIHQERIETEFSFRTRVIDYIWARLPIITTEGDSIAKMVKEKNIGEVIKYGDAHQLARVMESMLTNKSLREIYKKNLNKIAPRFYWENVSRPLVKYCINADYAVDKKKIMWMIDLQNSKISTIVRKNFEDATNVLVLTNNKYKDTQLFGEKHLGKVSYLEVDESIDKQKVGHEILDKVGLIKSKMSKRYKFDGIIVRDAFSEITPKFFYDLINVLSAKLKSEGMLFFMMPEARGLSSAFGGERIASRRDSTIDDFTIEYILKNADFQVMDKGIWDKIEDSGNGEGMEKAGEIYGKNELFELFQIKLSKENFKELKLLSSLDVLKSKELAEDKTIRGKLRKYVYLLTSMYFENLRKSYNESMKAVNNNIQLQINREINELNRKNRERMLLIYFNIFNTLKAEIKNLGYDVKSLRELFESIESKSRLPLNLDQKLETLFKSFENIDRIMGLTISSKYYLAKKL